MIKLKNILLEEREERSAGIIPYYNNNGEIQYLLLKNKNIWGFPKGHVEKGESEIKAAKRETSEETGLHNIEVHSNWKATTNYIIKWDFENNRKFEKPKQKEVTYFLGKTNSKKVKLSHEHDAYKWLTYENAMNTISFNKKLIKRANEYIVRK